MSAKKYWPYFDIDDSIWRKLLAYALFIPRERLIYVRGLKRDLKRGTLPACYTMKGGEIPSYLDVFKWMVRDVNKVFAGE